MRRQGGAGKVPLFLFKKLPFLFLGKSINTHTQHHAALNSQGNFPISECSGCSRSGLVSTLLLLGSTFLFHVQVWFFSLALADMAFLTVDIRNFSLLN